MTKNKPKTYVGIVLDRSGSMGSIRNSMIENHNQQLRDIRLAAGDQNVEVIRTQFDYPDQIEITGPMPLSEVPDLTFETYVPRGSTALNDAIGETMSRLGSIKLGKKDAVLLVIMTDGIENASVKFTHEEIKNMVQDRESTGQWTITYLGANQDVDKVASTYGFNVNNVGSYHATRRGVATVSGTTSSAYGSYFTVRNANSTASPGFYGTSGTVTVVPEEENE